MKEMYVLYFNVHTFILLQKYTHFLQLQNTDYFGTWHRT